MPIIQNITVMANNDADINFDVGPDEGQSLIGTTIYWRAYPQQFGSPIAGELPVIVKQTDNGLQVTDPDFGKFTVQIAKTDTVNLLHNYYHETTIVDGNGDVVTTVTIGILTVLPTELRL
jgi:hypothetical protein